MRPQASPLDLLLLFLQIRRDYFSIFFFFNDTATTEIYTLSLHDALPIPWIALVPDISGVCRVFGTLEITTNPRSEEHTSEIQSPDHLVCRLLLEKKKSLDVTTSVWTLLRNASRSVPRHQRL